MRSSVPLMLLSASLASAHYLFPALIFNGQVSNNWQYVKLTKNQYSHGPVTDVTSNDLRCYADPAGPIPSTANVAAGSTVGFTVSPLIGHQGPLMFYMAKVPAGKTAATFDGSGAVWFKIWEDHPQITSSGITWPMDATSVSVKIPSCIPNGEYLLRVEHIGLHGASSPGGAQIYLSCAQINVTGGGSKTPTGLVAFPGAYPANHPGLVINIWWPIPTSYTNPGPAPFTC